MKLITGWKKSLKFWSVQLNTIGLAISASYGAMYEQLKETIPPAYMGGITAAVFLLAIAARLISQEKK